MEEWRPSLQNTTPHPPISHSQWWYYAGGIVAVALVGAIVQFRSSRDEDEKEDVRATRGAHERTHSTHASPPHSQRHYRTLPDRDPYTAGRPVRMAGRPLAHAQYGSSW